MNFPSINFNTVRDVGNNLPEVFLDASTYMEMQPKITAWNHDFTMPGQFVFSLENCVAAVLRFISTTTIGTGFAGAGIGYHLLTGLSMCAVGVVGHFRKADLEQQVKPDMTKGFQHVVLAVYNLALFLLSSIAAIAYAIAPERCEAADRFARNWIEHFAGTSVTAIFTPDDLDNLAAAQPGLSAAPAAPSSPQANNNNPVAAGSPAVAPVAPRTMRRSLSNFMGALLNVPPTPPKPPRSPQAQQSSAAPAPQTP